MPITSTLLHLQIESAQVRHDIPNLYMPNADTWVADMNGSVIGFIALLGNEVGAIFVEPEFHGAGAGKALMDKARGIHGDLEVEVFKENSIGRKFYSRYGFELLEEKTFELTGDAVLRLKTFSLVEEQWRLGDAPFIYPAAFQGAI